MRGELAQAETWASGVRTPLPNYDARPDAAAPMLSCVPAIAPGNLMFYHGAQIFP